MAKSLDYQSGLSPNDHALIAEAVRRVQRRIGSADRTAVVQAVSSAVLQGRRDLFGLVKAGSTVGDPAQ